MPKSEVRKLTPSIPYSEVPFMAETMYAHFIQDQPLFAAVDPQFTPAWRDAFGAAIQALLAMPTPFTALSEVKIATQAVNEAMRAGSQQLHWLFLYVKRAWPGDQSRYDAFGLRFYTRAHRVQGPMLQLMKMAHAQAVFNFSALSARGYMEAQLDELEASITQLEAAKMAQLAAKSVRVEANEAYYTVVNEVWGYMQLLAEVRDFVFPSSPARRELYYLYPKNYWKHRRKKKPETVVVESEAKVIAPIDAAQIENMPLES